MFGSKIFAEIKAVGGLLAGLRADFSDAKLTWTAIQRDIADVKNVLAEVRTLTGHTATAITVATTAPLPAATATAAPLPSAPTSVATTGFQSQLTADVAGVKPLEGVKLP